MTNQYTIEPTAARRQLLISLPLLLLVLATGYASRRYEHYLPVIIQKRSGDALWASSVFALLMILRPCWSTLKITIAALVISYCVEFSQLYHRPWIDLIRSYDLGKLILGTTFFWLDQLAYTVGVLLIIPFDLILKKRQLSA